MGCPASPVTAIGAAFCLLCGVFWLTGDAPVPVRRRVAAQRPDSRSENENSIMIKVSASFS
jgi:hypothetical protein